MQQPKTPSFPHHKLDAYRVAVEMTREAEGIASRLSGRHRRIADQLGRAALAVPLLIVRALTAGPALRSDSGSRKPVASAQRWRPPANWRGSSVSATR